LLGAPENITDLVIPRNMIAPNSFVVQWSEPYSNPVCGPVQYLITVSTGGIVISNDTINRTTYTANGLSQNTEYRINFTAINKGGKSYTTSVKATTGNGGKSIKCSVCTLYNKYPSVCTIVHCKYPVCTVPSCINIYEKLVVC